MTQNERTAYRYRNTLDAFITIGRQEGIRGYYKGLGSSLLGVSHVAVQFPLYEKLKTYLRKLLILFFFKEQRRWMLIKRFRC